MNVFALAQLLERHRYDESSEETLQAGVAVVLGKIRTPFAREVRLTDEDRVDFVIGRIGLECKIGGGLSALVRQLDRYAASDALDALLVVTTRTSHARVPRELRGKPVAVVTTMGGLV